MLTYSNNALEFVAAPALAPAEVVVDQALMEQYNAELQAVRIISFSGSVQRSEFFPQAETVPLPEEDDDL